MTIKTRKAQIKQSKDIADIMRAILNAEELIDQDKEHCWVVGLDAKLRIKFIELVSLGCLTSSIVHPRETFRLAIMQAVASVMICHNHPSGDCKPSSDDIAITQRLHAAGEILGITLLDHVIVGDNEHYSFHDSKII